MKQRFGIRELGLSAAGFLLSSLLFAQAPAEPTASHRSLLRALEQTGSALSIEDASSGGAREFTVQWRSAQWPSARKQSAASSADSLTVQRVQIVNRTERSAPPPRERSSELSRDQVVVVARDRQGLIRYSQTLLDPRLIISESPDEHGNLNREDFYRSDVNFTVLVPSSIDVAEIVIFKPDWDRAGALHLSQVVALRTPLEAK